MNFRKYENLFKWDEKYSVGVTEIDKQHKVIFSILDKLYNSLKVGRVDIVVNEILPELEAYTIFHFKKEEYYFIKFNFSETEAHTEEHELFKRRLEEYRLEMQTGRESIGYELMVFIKNWIDNHILISDQKYSDCFKQNGLN